MACVFGLKLSRQLASGLGLLELLLSSLELINLFLLFWNHKITFGDDRSHNGGNNKFYGLSNNGFYGLSNNKFYGLSNNKFYGFYGSHNGGNSKFYSLSNKKFYNLSNNRFYGFYNLSNNKFYGGIIFKVDHNLWDFLILNNILLYKYNFT